MKQSIKDFLKKMLLRKYDSNSMLELSDEDFNFLNCDENAMKFLAKLHNMKLQYDKFLSNYYQKEDEVRDIRDLIENSVWVKDNTNKRVLLKLEDVEDYYLDISSGRTELCEEEFDVDGVRKMTKYWCATLGSKDLVALQKRYPCGGICISSEIESYKKLRKTFEELNNW